MCFNLACVTGILIGTAEMIEFSSKRVFFIAYELFLHIFSLLILMELLRTALTSSHTNNRQFDAPSIQRTFANRTYASSFEEVTLLAPVIEI